MERAAHGEFVRFEATHPAADGSLRHVDFSIKPVLGDAGEVLFLIPEGSDITDKKKAEEELKRYRDHLEELVTERTRDLRDALEKVKTLQGLLPICSSCKKIRDDKGYWTQLEVYFSNHTDAQFSHGLCPECAEKMMKELKKMKQEDLS